MSYLPSRTGSAAINDTPGPSNRDEGRRAGGGRAFNPRGTFTKDISHMMYAFGDVRDPDPISVAIMEDLTVDFLYDLCMRARPSPLNVPHVDQSYPPIGRLKVKVDDFKHALRKDPKKLGRLEELLYLETVIKEARKTFDEKEYGKEDDAPQPAAPSPGPSGAQQQHAATTTETNQDDTDGPGEPGAPRPVKRRKSSAADTSDAKGKQKATD